MAWDIGMIFVLALPNLGGTIIHGPAQQPTLVDMIPCTPKLGAQKYIAPLY